jgi:SAM-dependent methyltransferase
MAGWSTLERLTLAEIGRAIYFMALNILHRPLVRRTYHDPYHVLFRDFVAIGTALTSPAVLELGSRNVSGITRRDLFPHSSEYVGFDILPGEGVDMVGDIHRLSGYCPAQHFDIVYSISVFEHLLFPWKAVLEINKVLKKGGYVYLSTHPVWPEHEMPWDFWRFPRNGFHGLFNRHTGFEILSLAEGLPCKAYSLANDVPTRRLWFRTMNQGVALIARKTGEYRDDLLKWDIDVADAVDNMYPGKPSVE